MPAFVPPGGAIIARKLKRIVAARATGATGRARATTSSALGLHGGLAFRMALGIVGMVLLAAAVAIVWRVLA